MNDPDSPLLHGWNQPQDFGVDLYPGLGDPFAGPPALINPKVLPAQGAKPGFMSNIGELKQMLDRMGGLDGVLSTMGKVQKFFTTMKQMAPLLRIFMGKGGGAATAAGIRRKSGGGSRRRRTRRKTGKPSLRSSRRMSKRR